MPRFDPAGMPSLCALFVGVWVLAMSLWGDRAAMWIDTRFGVAWAVSALVMAFAFPFAAMGLLLGLLTPGWRPLLSAVGVGSVSFVGVQFFTTGLKHPGGGADVSEWIGWSWVLMPVLVAAVGLLFAVLFRTLARGGLWRPIEQTDPPTLCWRCGYEVGAHRPEKCSECATEWAVGRVHRRTVSVVVRSACRGAPYAAAAMAVIGGSVVAWFVATRTAPSRRFLAAFGDGGAAWCNVDAKIGSPHRYIGVLPNAIGRWLTEPDEAGRRLLVSYNPRPGVGFPVLQVRVAKAVPSPWDASRDMGETGWPVIAADFTADQAEWVCRHGVPDALRAALLDAANRESWTVLAGTSLKERVPIDPGPFLIHQSGEPVAAPGPSP